MVIPHGTSNSFRKPGSWPLYHGGSLTHIYQRFKSFYLLHLRKDLILLNSVYTYWITWNMKIVTRTSIGTAFQRNQQRNMKIRNVWKLVCKNRLAKHLEWSRISVHVQYHHRFQCKVSAKKQVKAETRIQTGNETPNACCRLASVPTLDRNW